VEIDSQNFFAFSFVVLFFFCWWNATVTGVDTARQDVYSKTTSLRQLKAFMEKIGTR
jgi:hypothetical protein